MKSGAENGDRVVYPWKAQRNTFDCQKHIYISDLLSRGLRAAFTTRAK